MAHDRGESREAARPSLPFAGLHALFIVAHYDDEVLGAGAQFRSFGKLTFLHVTDGAASARLARAKGHPTRAAYARARRQELRDALATACVAAECREIGYRDLEVSFHMADLVRRLTRAIPEVAPDIIFTHAFEGGHPDHDATAFAVRTALERLGSRVPLWELTGYHRAADGMVRSRFPQTGGAATVSFAVSPAERDLKRRMLACFISQLDVVEQFSLTEEQFRLAPPYEFALTRSPQSLGYEPDWLVGAPLWHALHRAAEAELSLGRSGTPRRLLLRLRIGWTMWTRRAHPDHPSLLRLMRRWSPLSR